MNIQELTIQENELLKQVRNITGLMDEKAQKLKKLGIFSSYKRLHQDYVSLAVGGDIEALKRVTFIQWYSVSEPSCFIGIPGPAWGDDSRLDKGTEKEVFALVQHSILSDQIDNEFRGMLALYFLISPYYFEAFWDNPVILTKLRRYSQEFDISVYAKDFPSKSFIDRGQMGEYWLSRLAKADAG
ncbi:MAG: hypothetical protein PVF83_00790 [Anaerolineales bacterium]|jgi:hypothetical protein